MTDSGAMNAFFFHPLAVVYLNNKNNSTKAKTEKQKPVSTAYFYISVNYSKIFRQIQSLCMFFLRPLLFISRE